MARVNVEERAFSECGRFQKFCRQAGIGEKLAMGTLVFLWHDSQAMGRSSGSQDEILMWSRTFDELEGEKVFKGLLLGMYIAPLKETGQYEIRGNKKHVDKLAELPDKRSEIGRLGGLKSGEARRLAREAKSNQKEANREAKGSKPDFGSDLLGSKMSDSNKIEPNAKQTGTDSKSNADAEQFNAIQSSASSRPDHAGRVIDSLFNCDATANEMFALVTKDTQRAWVKKYNGDIEWLKKEMLLASEWLKNRTRPPSNLGRFLSDWLKSSWAKLHGNQPELDDAPPKDVETNRTTWEAYREAFSERWHQEPVRNSKVNANINQFVQRVGKDAPSIIKFYLEHNDGFYIKSLHPVSLALRDAEGLATQWRNKKQVTQGDVRNIEARNHTKSQLQRAEAGEF